MEPQGDAIAHAQAVGLEAAIFASAAAADLNPPAASTGQMQIRQRAYCFLLAPMYSPCAYTRCACFCAGSALVSPRLLARVDKAGKPACERCGRRLADCKGKLYACPPGKCCQHCYDAVRPVVHLETKQQRVKRPYKALQSTQQWKRRKQLHSAITEASQQIGCWMRWKERCLPTQRSRDPQMEAEGLQQLTARSC